MTIMQYAFQTARPFRATEKTRTAKPETTLIEKIKAVLIGFEKAAFEKALLAKRDLDSILTRLCNRFCFQELAAVLFFWNSLPQVRYAR